jgi:diguanylate cyclase (GGDEF)-like protein
MEEALLQNTLNKSLLPMAVINTNGTLIWISTHLSTLTKGEIKSGSNAGDINIKELFFVDINRQKLKEAIASKHCQTLFYNSMKTRGKDLTIHLGEVTFEHRVMVLSQQYGDHRILDNQETDALTGLLNRSVFEKFLNDPMEIDTSLDCSIILIDLDRFKRINDTLGHPIGDKLLKLVADRFRRLLRPNDILIRIGGDEFVLMIRDKIDDQTLISLAERIITSASKTFILQSHQIDIGASIGIATLNDTYRHFKELYRHADLALYASKRNGGSQASIFTTDLEVQAQYRRSIEIGLRRALLKNEFRIAYQCQIDVSSKKVTGLDTILQWYSELLGKVDTKTFYPIAKDIGELNKIGYWVFEQAMKDTEGLLAASLLSFNVTASQLLDPDFVTRFSALLSKYKMKPNSVELIITEKSFLEIRACEVVKSLSSLGVMIAICDPSTGYESLRFLKRMPISRMRVDRQFTHAIDKNSESLEAIKAISDIGEMLCIPVVAQDVKSESELLKLKKDGCDNIEGFFSSPLLNVQQLRGVLNRDNKP